MTELSRFYVVGWQGGAEPPPLGELFLNAAGGPALHWEDAARFSSFESARAAAERAGLTSYTVQRIIREAV